jgi:enamine deaminase RidA (YjgF/YER057c/UK114 family)
LVKGAAARSSVLDAKSVVTCRLESLRYETNLIVTSHEVASDPAMNPEARLQHLNLELPPAPVPVALYKPLVTVHTMSYVSGHGPLKTDKSLMTGRVGDEVDAAFGKAAARQTGLAILATLRAHLGSLDRVKRVVKVLGMVNCTPDFRDHPVVINGCSELFRDVFGEENGVGARSAVGMGSLPGNITVEIEAIFELHE